MDGSQFDQLARACGALRTRRTAVAIAAGAFAAAIPGGFDSKGKRKRRKKCAKSCKKGCCTSKRGKCIKPANQDPTRCGTGGGICQSIGCPGCDASRPCPTGQCCTGAGVCGECKVFVTERLPQQGALGGLAGADAACQTRATAAGLPGTYLAWLSDSSATPASRFTKSIMPYTLPSGETVATSWADLTNGAPLSHAINQMANGQLFAGNGNTVWTNTLADGTAGGASATGNCVNWTSAEPGIEGDIGRAAESSVLWTAGGFIQCAAEGRLYCFQQR